MFEKAGAKGMRKLFTELGFLEPVPADRTAILGSGYKFQGAPPGFTFQYSLSNASPRPEADDGPEEADNGSEEANNGPEGDDVEHDDDYSDEEVVESDCESALGDSESDGSLSEEEACESEYNLVEPVHESSIPWLAVKRGSVVRYRFDNGWDIGRVVKTLFGNQTSYRVYYGSDQRAV